MDTNKGFAHPLVLLGILVVLLGVVAFVVVLKPFSSGMETSKNPTPTVIPTLSPFPTTNQTPTLTPKPTLKLTSTPIPTKTSTPTPTFTLTPTPTISPHKVACVILRSDPSGGKAPFQAFYTASATFDYMGNPSDNDQIVAAQWDYDGDWRWDTDFDHNLTQTYTYNQAGNYNAKMRVQTRDGLTSEICSKDINING